MDKKKKRSPKKTDPNELTIQEETFVSELVKGETQRQAYLKAFPHSENWKRKSIDEEACKLLKITKVSTRRSELKKKLIEASEKKTIADAREVLELYTSIARGEIEEEVVIVEGIGKGFSEARKVKKEAQLKDRLKAIERLEKILGVDKSFKRSKKRLNIVDDLPKEG